MRVTAQAPDPGVGLNARKSSRIPASMEHVYFDHNATTPLDDKVLEAMLPYLRERFGNASSRHEFGIVARRAIDTARQQVAALVNAQPAQVIFVSGGTEANNLFVKGAAGYLKPSQIAVSAIEHPCIAKPAQELARQGWKVRKLAVTGDGQMELADVDAAPRSRPASSR
jgi:cysteine desulfurase